jgi:hypothetical protein
MMSTEMKTLRAWLWILLLGLLAWSTPPFALGQETPTVETPAEADAAETGAAGGGGDGGAGGETGVTEDAEVAEEPPEAASDAKRVVRIRKVLELDKHRLRWLRTELRARTRWFEELATGMDEVATERLEVKEQLDAMEADPEADAAEVEALHAKLAELDESFELFDTQTDLALNAEKTVSKQLDAMETKIERDELALGRGESRASDASRGCALRAARAHRERKAGATARAYSDGRAHAAASGDGEEALLEDDRGAAPGAAGPRSQGA